MFNYIIAGLALGAIYAIAAASITVTYVSTGILNFAFASFAYFLARAYYYLHVQQGWSIVAAALIRIVAMIGFFVALPPLALICFGTQTINSAPGLVPVPVHVFHVFGAAVGLDQVVNYAFLLAI